MSKEKFGLRFTIVCCSLWLGLIVAVVGLGVTIGLGKLTAAIEACGERDE